MKILINSKDIWFKLGVEYCIEQVCYRSQGMDYCQPENRLSGCSDADLIILPLNGYHDYKYLYELASRFHGLIIGVTTSKNIKPGRLVSSGNIIWVSSRESIACVQQLLLELQRLEVFRHNGEPEFSAIKAKEGIPLSQREMVIIDHVAAGMPANEIARALGLRVKTIYAHLDKIRANFRLRGGSHFHRFMISPLSYHIF